MMAGASRRRGSQSGDIIRGNCAMQRNAMPCYGTLLSLHSLVVSFSDL